MAKATTKTNAHRTLNDLCAAYLAHLETKGKSMMTRASYGADLQVALGVLGADTQLLALTAKKVQAFYDSDAVTKTRTGKGKAQPTIAKTRRVLRMALVWATEQDWLAAAPVPDLKPKPENPSAEPKSKPKKGKTKAPGRKGAAAKEAAPAPEPA